MCRFGITAQIMGYCECCGCDPCDCHGVNDENETYGQFWRMGAPEFNGTRQINAMVSRSIGIKSNHDIKMAYRYGTARRELHYDVPSIGQIAGRSRCHSIVRGCRAFGGAC